MKKMILQLLPELLEKVLDLLLQKDLINLSSCNSALNESLREHLWSTVKIPINKLLCYDFRADPSLLRNFKYIRKLYFFGVTLPVTWKEMGELVVSNYNTILECCDPDMLCSTFSSNDVFDRICRLDRLTELNLDSTLTNNSNISKVANRLSGLQVLKIRRTKVTDKGLADIGKLRSLELLDVGGCNITDLGLSHIGLAYSLQELNISNCRKVTDHGFLYLTNLQLRDLIIHYCNVSDAVVPYLNSITTLRYVDIGRTLIMDEGLRQLSTVPQLTRLDCGYSRNITDSGMRFLSRLYSLTSLDLSFTYVTDEAMSHLSQLKCLKELDVSLCKQITGSGFSYFGRSSSLQILHLYSCEVTDETACFIGELTYLTYLNIGQNPITDEGFKCLFRLNHLRELDISQCNVTDESMKSITQFTSLRKLYLSRTNVSDKCVAQLRALRNLTIVNEA